MEGLKHIKEESVDIRESEILSASPELLNILLSDHTTQHNIFWATNDYAQNGSGYAYKDEITPEKITGQNGMLIMPRVLKEKHLQQARIRDKAEVFTPSWICNAQNNLVDNAWFGRDNVFNTEHEEGGVHSWIVNAGKIAFPKGKTWKTYIKSTRLEITCGEAPYLVSRYDTTTGDYIPVRQRIGLLDRKLRIVGENTSTPEEWKEWAIVAFKNTYGYEWQGDNLLLAREALLFTYVDFYAEKFQIMPSIDDLKEVAEIISWNVWQMDGLKGVVPDSCHDIIQPASLFGDTEEEVTHCMGCEKNNIRAHNGLYCMVMDWEKGEAIQYISLLKR